MRNRTSPFLTGVLASTGTSITRPRTSGTICTTYLMTRTSGEDGANTFSIRMSVVRATIGITTTVTCEVVFQGSHFSLIKISQTNAE